MVSAGWKNNAAQALIVSGYVAEAKIMLRSENLRFLLFSHLVSTCPPFSIIGFFQLHANYFAHKRNNHNALAQMQA